jgi:hypothetical protein
MMTHRISVAYECSLKEKNAEIAEVVQRKREFSKSSVAFFSASSAFKLSVWSNAVSLLVVLRQILSSESFEPPANEKLRQREGVTGV